MVIGRGFPVQHPATIESLCPDVPPAWQKSAKVEGSRVRRITRPMLPPHAAHQEAVHSDGNQKMGNAIGK
jgi:hypothetical protein